MLTPDDILFSQAVCKSSALSMFLPSLLDEVLRSPVAAFTTPLLARFVFLAMMQPLAFHVLVKSGLGVST